MQACRRVHNGAAGTAGGQRLRTVRHACQSRNARGGAFGQSGEVVAPFQEGHDAPGRRGRTHGRRQIGEVPELSPNIVRGSARWASKPADSSTHVGANRSTVGATTSSKARR